MICLARGRGNKYFVAEGLGVLRMAMGHYYFGCSCRSWSVRKRSEEETTKWMMIDYEKRHS